MNRLLRELRSLVRLHQDLGIDTYPASPELLHFLRPSPLPRPVAPPRPVPPPRPERTRRAAPPTASPEALRALGEKVTACEQCPLCHRRLGLVPGRGAAKARLLFVGDWSRQNQANFSSAVIFGPDEDLMLANMIRAMDLRPEEVYVTNSIKCGPRPEEAPERCLPSCRPLLEAEILAVMPDCICVMGDAATHNLLGGEAPLIRRRGHFHDLRLGGAVFKVMPTFHPEFLLRLTDMKPATWSDLLMIQARLRLA